MNKSDTINIGNKLNQIINNAIGALFVQGELTQLSYSSFDLSATTIKEGDNDEIELSYPVGFSPSKQTLFAKHKYKKDELIGRYSFLANTQLSVNGIYQLSTIIEAMLGDLIRSIIIKYPKKLGKKQSINIATILEASTLEELYLHAVNSKLNELSYKSPIDFANEARDILSINLLECPAYHKYIEIKATRDILVHNKGFANEIYVSKAGTHARVESGEYLPVNAIYFLESYESCLQFSEWIEEQCHGIWPSNEFENKQQAKVKTQEEN